MSVKSKIQNGSLNFPRFFVYAPRVRKKKNSILIKTNRIMEEEEHFVDIIDDEFEHYALESKKKYFHAVAMLEHIDFLKIEDQIGKVKNDF